MPCIRGAREEKQQNDLTSLAETDADDDAGDRLGFFTVVLSSASGSCVERIIRGGTGPGGAQRGRRARRRATLEHR